MHDLNALAVLAAKTASLQEVHGTFTCTNCADGPSWWETSLLSVLTALLVALIASYVGYRFNKRLLKDQSDEQIKLMRVGTQRDAAIRVELAAHDAKQLGTKATPGKSDDWKPVLEIIHKRLFPETVQLSNDELAERFRSCHLAVLFASESDLMLHSIAVRRAFASLQTGLRDLIDGNPISDATFLTGQEMLDMVFHGDEPGTYYAYEQWIMDHDGPI